MSTSNALGRQVVLVVGAGVAAAALLIVSTFDGDTFVDRRVGSAGEWFAGIVGTAVLVWTLGEPRRLARRDREQHELEEQRARDIRRIDREHKAALGVMRAITELDYRPGPFIKAQPEIWSTHVSLELNGHLLGSTEAHERVRVAIDLLRRYYHARGREHSSDADVQRLHQVVPLMLEATFRTALAVAREEPLPPWSSSDGTYVWPIRAEHVPDWMAEHGLALDTP